MFVHDMAKNGINKSPIMYKPRVTKTSEVRLPKINITPGISAINSTKAIENKSPNTIEIFMSALSGSNSLA